MEPKEQEATTETRATEERASQTDISKSETPTTYTQADLDRAISKAIQTREEKLRTSFEEERLAEQQKYKELFERREAELKKLQLSQETTSYLAGKQLTDLAPVFEADINSAEGRKAMADAVADLVQRKAEEMIKSKIATGTTAKSQESATSSKPDQMSAEEYAAWKKANRIY